MTAVGMATTTTPQRRATPRHRVDLPVTLARPHGNPVTAHTVDLSTGGARVACDRPLKIDEVLEFDLVCDGGETHVCGHCTVLREHVGQTYAVRFEHLAETELERLERALTRRTS
jgi:hypothetical protein